MAGQSFFRSNFAHVAFGFLLMGGWAAWANRAHGLEGAWAPALAQGVVSGGLTWIIKTALEWLDGRIGGIAAWIVPPILTAGSILAVLIGVHRLVGTPEIVATIAFPWTVSTLYAIVYTAGLVRARRKAG